MRFGSPLLSSGSGIDYLAAESLPIIPIIEICDDKRVLIEGHQGILGYSCCEILVKVRYGRICISGESLKITKMSKEKLVITGNICVVHLQR